MREGRLGSRYVTTVHYECPRRNLGNHSASTFDPIDSMTMNKKSIISVGLVLLTIAGIFWLYLKQQDEGASGKPDGPAKAHAKSPSTPPGGSTIAVERKSQDAKESIASLRAAKLVWHDVNEARNRLNQALASNDYKIWEPVIGELVNPNYRREEAIAVLSELLEHRDWRVRIRAAQELHELGSNAGLPTLRLALQSASGGADIPSIMVLTAVRTLQRAGETIDPQDLKAVYQKYQSDELIKIAAQQGAPWTADIVRQKRATNAMIVPTELLAAYLGMNDAESIQRFNLLLSINAESKVLGNWALYRATGDVAPLQYLVDVVRSFNGLSGPIVDITGDAGSMAIHLLSITQHPLVEKTLEEIMDHQVGKEGGLGISFSGALASLYFVQKDYDFIDQRLSNFMRGNYPASGAGSGLLWDIASSRRTPEIEELALARNPGEYDLRFIRMRGRPLIGPITLKGSRRGSGFVVCS